jgi:hypothetical protein
MTVILELAVTELLSFGIKNWLNWQGKKTILCFPAWLACCLCPGYCGRGSYLDAKHHVSSLNWDHVVGRQYSPNSLLVSCCTPCWLLFQPSWVMIPGWEPKIWPLASAMVCCVPSPLLHSGWNNPLFYRGLLRHFWYKVYKLLKPSEPVIMIDLDHVVEWFNRTFRTSSVRTCLPDFSNMLVISRALDLLFFLD